jgi:hypothetical protein
VTGHLAQGLRRAHLLADGSSADRLPDRAVGRVMLAADDTMAAVDKGGERARADLRETSRAGPLPLAVAGRPRAIAAGQADGMAVPDPHPLGALARPARLHPRLQPPH